jgi:hypothetical protein
MRRLAITSTVALVLSLATAMAALAAHPSLPASFSGGDGRGDPVSFKLSKTGKVTYAAAGYECKGKSGQGNAQTKKTGGAVTKAGKLTITYTYRGIKVKFSVTFTSKTAAKGKVTFTSSSCTARAESFTANAG